MSEAAGRATIPAPSSAPLGLRLAGGSDLPLYALCAALVLAFHYRLALPGRALVANDFRALFIALRGGLQQTLRGGEFPLWQRGIFAGYPIVGDIQPQLFNPLTWLTMPLDPARGVTVQSLLELCLCAVGMAFWMRQRGLRRLESLFAAAAFALSLKQTVHLHHWTFAGSTCAWPWMLAGLDGYATTRERRFFVLAVLATCGSWIGGSPQMAYFGCALAAVYSLTLRDWRIVLAVPLGVALAAPLLLPVAELSGLGPRGAGITYNFAASWSWPDRSVWAAMVLPRVWGGRPNFSGPMNYWELQGYFGLLPMALALAAPFKRRGLWLFAGVAILCLWFSWGDHAWLGLHRLAVQFLPGYGGFRNPTRALMPGIFCVSLLAAEGLARLRRDPKARWPALGGLVALAVAIAFYAAHPPPRAQLSELRADALWAAFFLLAGAVLLVFQSQRRALFLLVPLLVADLAVQTWDSPEVGPAASEGHLLDEILRLTPRAPKPRRVTVLLDWGEGNNATYLAGLEGVTGYGPTPIQRVLTLLHATYTGRIQPPLPLDDDPNFPRLNVDSDLAGFFASPFAVLKSDEPYEKLRLRGTRALPRVYWVGAFEQADDLHLTAALHRAAQGNQAVLSEPLDWPSGEPAGPLDAQDIEVLVNRLKATVRAPRDGLVVVLDPFFPGWTARVDGKPAPLLRANFAFEAVPLKAGLHTLELSYFPDRLLPGAGIAFLAILLVFLLLRSPAVKRVDASR